MQLCTLTAIVVLLSSVLDDRSLHLQRKSEEPRRAVWQRARPRRRKRQPIFGLLFYILDFLPCTFYLIFLLPVYLLCHFRHHLKKNTLKWPFIKKIILACSMFVCSGGNKTPTSFHLATADHTLVFNRVLTT